jgi:hypothetical protein
MSELGIDIIKERLINAQRMQLKQMRHKLITQRPIQILAIHRRTHLYLTQNALYKNFITLHYSILRDLFLNLKFTALGKENACWLLVIILDAVEIS